MQSAASAATADRPASRSADRLRARLLAGVRSRLPWLATRAPRAVTAVMLNGAQCLAARVELLPDGRPHLADAAAGSADDLPLWRARKLFARSQPLLVLGTDERHLLTLDRPEVPDAELPLAVRWPLAEALECEPEALLSTVLALPRINDTLRPQVLAVAARLDRVQTHLKTLAAAGIKVRAVDVVDSALRGMVLTQPADGDGWVVLAPSGDTMCMALVWHGQLSALRTLALAPPAQRGDVQQQEQLALHVQRTIDLFERQATQLAIRQVLATAPTPRSPQTLQALRDALPPFARLFELAAALDTGPATPVAAAAQALSADNGDVTTLACVALARLADNHPGAVLAWARADSADSADSTASASPPAAVDSVAPLPPSAAHGGWAPPWRGEGSVDGTPVRAPSDPAAQTPAPTSAASARSAAVDAESVS